MEENYSKFETKEEKSSMDEDRNMPILEYKKI